MPNTFTVEPSQHQKSREKRVYSTQVRAILKSKLHTVVNEQQEGKCSYTGECMKGLAHGEGDLKYGSGTTMKAFGYYDSRLGKFPSKSNIFSQ